MIFGFANSWVQGFIESSTAVARLAVIGSQLHQLEGEQKSGGDDRDALVEGRRTHERLADTARPSDLVPPRFGRPRTDIK
jgi:hypothetical protein